MQLNNRNNKQFYKALNPDKGLLSGGYEKKARTFNLNGERPFMKGNKNRAYVSPSYISNVVFYGHSNEPVDYPHQQEVKHHLRPEGYNLNNYVVYDGFRQEKSTVAPSVRSNRTDRTESRRQ